MLPPDVRRMQTASGLLLGVVAVLVLCAGAWAIAAFQFELGARG
jgi:hypothetical protein